MILPDLRARQRAGGREFGAHSGDGIDGKFFLEQLAYLAGRLDAIREGERTLLDNSMLMLTSSIRTGNHEADHLPVVVVGRGGGQLRTGRSLDYLDRPERKMCNLYLSMMDRMGVRVDRFGDASQRLAGF